MTAPVTLAGNLVTAWTRWDRLPGDPIGARLLEDAVQAVAADLDMAGSSLRDAVTARRRAGMGCARAIADVLARAETRAAA